MKDLWITALATLMAGAVFAQNDADVRRYTQLHPHGTARFAGMGGAFTALGGDFSAMHINPASVAVFRFNELSLSTALEGREVSTSLNDNQSSAIAGQLAVANAGFVLTSEISDPFWKSFNIGLSISRINNFNEELSQDGVLNLGNTLMQDFANEASGLDPADLSNFGPRLAYDAFIIDDVSPGVYEGRVSQGQMRQEQLTETSGRMNDIAITAGANYNDRLYLGAGIGLVSSFYRSTNTIREEPTEPNTTDIVNYRYREDLQIEGLGVNFRVGAIYRFEQGFRVGASIQTPTGIRLQDNYRVSMRSTLKDPDEIVNATSGDDFLEYRIRTPWRFSVGAAGVIKGLAILSGQYEYVDFSAGQMLPSNRRTSGNPFSDVNEVMQTFYRPQHVLRGGAEFRLTKSLMARGGLAYWTNPIPSNATIIDGDPSLLQFSGGFGYRGAAWNLDLSYTYGRFNEPYRATGTGPLQELSNTLSTLAITLGIRL